MKTGKILASQLKTPSGRQAYLTELEKLLTELQTLLNVSPTAELKKRHPACGHRLRHPPWQLVDASHCARRAPGDHRKLV